MASTSHAPSRAYLDAVHEITHLYRSLPARPSIEEVKAAASVLETAAAEEQLRLQEICHQVVPPPGVPPELFSLLKEAREADVLFRSHEQRKEAAHLLELDGIFQKFDDLIQKASELVSGEVTEEERCDLGVGASGVLGIEAVVGDEGLIKKWEAEETEAHHSTALTRSASAKTKISISGETEIEKMSLMRVAALIEKFAKSGAKVVDLQDKLMDKVEWLPLSLGKLSNVVELNVSDNRIMALPDNIGGLKALRRLDVHSNQLINLPNSVGELLNLMDLDIHANRLKSLPASFGSLTSLINLDLGTNQFVQLPDVIGKVTSLKSLNAETNELEELPHTIGSCSSLVELRLDFNKLKALPEAIGSLGRLEVLTLHYNKVRVLPTTIGNLSRLKELDVSFNEIENLQEGLCFATSLVKLNVGKNFVDLRTLPTSIGNLKMLEELDISANQISVLPDSFRFLSKLRVLHADDTPIEVPPRQVAKLGAQAVVEYMAEFVSKRDVKSKLTKKKRRGFCSRICMLFWR